MYIDHSSCRHVDRFMELLKEVPLRDIVNAEPYMNGSEVGWKITADYDKTRIAIVVQHRNKDDIMLFLCRSNQFNEHTSVLNDNGKHQVRPIGPETDKALIEEMINYLLPVPYRT